MLPMHPGIFRTAGMKGAPLDLPARSRSGFASAKAGWRTPSHEGQTAGTRTQPSIRRRAERLITTLLTVQ